MRLWTGMIHPDQLLEDLLPYMEAGPHNHHVSLSHKRLREPSLAPQKMPVASVVSNDEDEELQRAIAASMEGKIEDDKSASDEKAAAVADDETDAALPKRHSCNLSILSISSVTSRGSISFRCCLLTRDIITRNISSALWCREGASGCSHSIWISPLPW